MFVPHIRIGHIEDNSRSVLVRAREVKLPGLFSTQTKAKLVGVEKGRVGNEFVKRPRARCLVI
jgi:hypothetical protein